MVSLMVWQLNMLVIHNKSVIIVFFSCESGGAGSLQKLQTSLFFLKEMSLHTSCNVTFDIALGIL